MTRLQVAQAAYHGAAEALDAAHAAARPELLACIAANKGREDDGWIAELVAIEDRHGLPQATDAQRAAKTELIAAAREQTTRDPEFLRQSLERQQLTIEAFAAARMYPQTERRLLDLCMRMA